LVGSWETPPFVSYPTLFALSEERYHHTQWLILLRFNSFVSSTCDYPFRDSVSPFRNDTFRWIRTIYYLFNIFKEQCFLKLVIVYICTKNPLFSIFVVWRGFEPTVKLLQFLSTSLYFHTYQRFALSFITTSYTVVQHIKSSL
jgi:hypothetical protein